MIFDNPTNLTLIPQLFVAADGFVSGLLGISILMIVGFGTLFLTSSFNSSDSLIATSFILMIVSVFLKYLNLLSDFFMFLCVVLFVGALIMSAVRKPLGA